MPKVTLSCSKGCIGLQLLDLTWLEGVAAEETAGANSGAWEQETPSPRLWLLGVGED